MSGFPMERRAARLQPDWMVAAMAGIGRRGRLAWETS